LLFSAGLSYRRWVKLFGLVLVAACGPGLAARDTRDVGRDSLASAAGDAKALRALFHDNVVDGGMWFDDAACAKEFGSGEEVPKHRLDSFAQCLAGLHMQASTRGDELGDVVVMTYAPGIEIEARVMLEDDGSHLAWIGYSSRRPIDALVPTITSAALESIRTSGDPNGPLDPSVASTLELDPTPTSHASYTWLRVCVDETGALTLADPFETTSAPAAVAFVAAAQKWTFKPFTIHDKPVAVCSMARMTYPPGQGPAEENLPMPPAMSGSHKNPLVFVEGSKSGQIHEGKRISGKKNILPDDHIKTAIERKHLHQVVGSFKICLDEHGAPESILPIRSTGFADYDRELLAGMHEWRYEPYVLDGVPTPVCTGVVFIYNQR
jgi:hypothetical protein